MKPYKWIQQERNYRVVLSSLGGDEILAKFRCSNCNSWVYTDSIEIPEPNMLGENNRESEVTVESEAYCTKENCGESFTVFVSNSFGGSDFEIDGISREDIFFKYFDEEVEQILSSTNYYDLFEENIVAILSLIEVDTDVDHKKILNRMILSQAITAMESYLLNALSILLTQNDKRVTNALRTIRSFDHRKYSNELFDGDKEAIITALVSSLKSESFHNLKGIKKYFQDILSINIDFDTSTLGRIVRLRHDIVHRNGQTIDGEEIEISNVDLRDKISVITDYVDHINEKILAISVT